MNIREYISLSFLALRTNIVRSVLTMLGIIIGVASVILLVSIGAGLQKFVTDQFASLGSNVVFVLPGKVDFKSGGGRPTATVSQFELTDIADLNRSGNAIKQASPVTQVTGTLRFRSNLTSVPVLGVWENIFDIRNLPVEAGKRISQNDVERSRKVIVLGPQVVKDLYGEETDPIGTTLTLNESRYTVVGVLESKGGGGLGVNVDAQVYIPLTTALKEFNQDKPYMIIVEVINQESVPEAAIQVQEILGKRLKEDEFTVVQQTEFLATINQFLGTATLALGGIAGISLLVGGIGIMNIMLVSVTERTREIGLRKAVGATPKEILIQFLIEAVILSVVGGCIGILLGSLGAMLIAQFIKTSISAWSVMIAFSFSAGIGILFGVAPAIRASRLNPIEALRYE